MMKTIHLIYLNFFHSVARSPGRSLRKLGDPTFFNATREGAISDTVAREGGSSTHRTQCPHFHATGDYCTADAVIRVSTSRSAPPFPPARCAGGNVLGAQRAGGKRRGGALQC